MNLKVFGYKPSIIETVIGGIVLAILLFWLYAKINRTIKEAREAKERRDLDAAINKNELAFDEQTYKNYADKLEEAMAYTNFGTDEDAIYSVFKKCESASDVLQLIKDFGKRDYKNYLGIGSTPLTLSGWLSRQLNQRELEKVNKILSDKGINIQF